MRHPALTYDQEVTMEETSVTSSEMRAVQVAIKCLAASLKQQGLLNAELYVARLQGHIDNDYPGAADKRVFDVVLNNFIEDIDRAKVQE